MNSIILTFDITAGETVTLPLSNSLSNPVGWEVDWGDGTTTTGTTPTDSVTYTYSS